MSMFIPTGAFVGAVEGVLQEINVEEETIRAIVAQLYAARDALSENQPGSVRETAFGGSWSGESLGYHTKLAHTHFIKAIAQMMETLAGTGERVQRYHDDITFYDEDSAARNKATNNRYNTAPALYHPPAPSTDGPKTMEA